LIAYRQQHAPARPATARRSLSVPVAVS
ncbi:MAG: hypothetical protein RI925_845, partial [Pseudomonadota bacterium]